MTKKDVHYIFLGLLILLAGLAYEKDFYSFGAIVVFVVSIAPDVEDKYNELG